MYNKDEWIVKMNLAAIFYGGYDPRSLPLEVQKQVEKLYGCVRKISEHKKEPMLNVIYEIAYKASIKLLNESDVLSLEI